VPTETITASDVVPARIRFTWALAAAVITFLTWQVVWVGGIAILTLDAILGAPFPPTFNAPVALFGEVWLWVVACFTIFLVLAVLARPVYARRSALLWFLALAVLYITGLITFGGFEVLWVAIMLFGSAAALLTWIRRLTRRAA
jgi:hypothetical protein